MQFPLEDLISLLPIFGLLCVAFIVIIIEATIRKSSTISYWISIIGILFSIGLTVWLFNISDFSFSNMFKMSPYGNFFSILFMTSALITIIFSKDYLIRDMAHQGEYYALILLSTTGMIFMATAADLIILFLGIELMSVCLYVLAGFTRKKLKSNEAALKYFLLGAFATGFLLYGMAFLYGITGTTRIESIINSYSIYDNLFLFWIGIGLILFGLAFKIASVPFHMWVPDVYEGAPTTISGFMSTAAKAAAFSAFILFFSNQILSEQKLQLVFAILATASMLIGNIIAIAQNNIKRMLAYSSIAHAGYMLIGLASGNQLGKDGILFYLCTYTLMNLGAFGLISFFERDEEKYLTFDDYVGFANKNPYYAALMTVFMLSLIGIPPFAGFFGKYYIFTAAINSGLIWLAIFGVLMSVISAYFYLRLVIVMYFKEPATYELKTDANPINNFLIFLNAVGLFILGIFPSLLMQTINKLL